MAETIAEQPVATNEGGIEKEKPKPSKTTVVGPSCPETCRKNC